MASYKYVATTNDASRTINGMIEASDEGAAIELIKKQGLRPISITPNKTKVSSSSQFFSTGQVKSSDIVTFTRQLSAMVGAGVPLIKALSTLEQHTESVTFKLELSAIIKDVEAGSSLGNALGKHPKTFSSVYVNMVRAGEGAGILEDILKRLALQQEKSAAMRKRVRGAMAYPISIMLVTIIAFFGLMLFVVPQIGKVIDNLGGGHVELPLLTRIMLGISSFTIAWWYLLIPAIIGSVYLLFRYIKTTSGRQNIDRLVLKVPVVRGIVKKVIVARFARTFAALSSSGLPILESLNVTARTLGNVVYEESLIEAARKVKNGQLLSKVMDEGGLFPPIVSQMIAVGEETGETEEVLVKVAEFYEDEVDVAIGSITSLIEPAIIVLLGSTVALIALSVIGPITSLAQHVQ